jgi:hypothetical protein
MRTAVVVFAAAVTFLVVVLLGVVRVGPSSRAPHSIELPRVAVTGRDAGTTRPPVRTEIRQDVDSGRVAP